MASPLSKELKAKYKKNAVTLRKGYKVKIMRGEYKKQIGKVVDIDLKKTRVHVEGIQHVKRSGAKSFYPLHPSNLQIIEAVFDDKKMRAKMEGRK